MIYDPVAYNPDAMRPTRVEVDLDQLEANLRAIERRVGSAAVMPILKANAYGHGMVPVARRLQQVGVTQVGVAYLEEALLLRKAGIETEILVLGGIAGNQIPYFIEAGLSMTASSVDKLRRINDAACTVGRRAKVHLKIDTGMGRIGTQYYSAPSLLEAALTADGVDVEGVYSHFANADAKDVTSAQLQLERFEEALAFYEQRSLPTPVRHIANSGGILALPESHLDLVRPGILFYGVYPSTEVERSVDVAPALRWLSQVAYFKVVKPDHSVSYGSTWTATEETRIVTVPVGYGDGYFRQLSNQGEVLIGGRRYPIRGRVCMDQFMVDIGWDSAYNGDEVVLLGTQRSAEITAVDIAHWAGTIPYEVLTNINTRVPRSYHTESGDHITPK